MARPEPLADSDDIYYAVSAGTDAAVADIIAHISGTTVTAAGIYASSEPLDNGC